MIVVDASTDGIIPWADSQNSRVECNCMHSQPTRVEIDDC